jgi:hypothetical protein
MIDMPTIKQCQNVVAMVKLQAGNTREKNVASPTTSESDLV